MIASVYIKDGNIHFYNEDRKFTDLGGLAYELGRPFLDFICYDPKKFDEVFKEIAEWFDFDYAHIGALEPEYINEIKLYMVEIQKKEIYIYFYLQLLIEFVYAFIESPKEAVMMLDRKIPGAKNKLSWAMDFVWQEPPPGKVYLGKEKRLFRAAMDAVSIMSDHIRLAQRAVTAEINALLVLREHATPQTDSPMEYLYMLELYRQEHGGEGFIYLENPFRTFYGLVKEPEIAQLYSIDFIPDLCRFEFIKMIEHDIFIKKCKNCEHFFIPRGRADTEYCNRLYKDTGRKCNEIGAMIRYEKNVAENPILNAHKKAYRRFNSRVRNKKMTQTEFLQWSTEASKKRDACLADKLPFDEFIAWLEQGRIRKPR